MTVRPPRRRIFSSAKEDARIASKAAAAGHCQSPSYRLAFQDPEFLLRDELRPVRLQLELLKPELILQEHRIESTVVVFGSARIPEPQSAADGLASAKEALQRDAANPALQRSLRIAQRKMANSRYYEEARRLGRLIAAHSDDHRFVVMTGGGPGIMGAANRRAHEARAPPPDAPQGYLAASTAWSGMCHKMASNPVRFCRECAPRAPLALSLRRDECCIRLVHVVLTQPGQQLESDQSSHGGVK